MKLSREFKIGFVALLAVALAIWGINFLHGKNIFSSIQRYYAVYGNVKGLVENAGVFLNGYKVGNVTGIRFDENNVDNIVVEISLEGKLKLRKNTMLMLASGSIISGAKDMNIIMGDGNGYCQSGDTLLSAVQLDLTELINPLRIKIESAITSIDTLMLALNDLLDENTRTGLQGSISNLQSATSSLKQTLQPSGSLTQTLGSLEDITANLKKSNADIAALLSNFAAVSDTLKQSELKSLIDQAGKTFAEASVLLAQINSGEGTAGQLIVNDAAYQNLNSALASLDSLLIDLREHPKRYVHLSVFGKKDK
ncbi:MAG: MCE family protein [Bacteroidales bacterium]|nr:MCE family protein [Bacteroidales bacterium]